jgi:hypothetical protein
MRSFTSKARVEEAAAGGVDGAMKNFTSTSSRI